MKLNSTAFLMAIAAAALGTLTAGLIMSYGRGSVELLAKAHSGYDS